MDTNINFRVTQDPGNRIPASCKEVECDAYRNGWQTIVPNDMADQVRAIARQTGRHCTEDRFDDTLTRFTFPPGQEGFKGGEHDHTIQVDDRQHFSRQTGVAYLGPGSHSSQQWHWHGETDRQRLSAQSWVDDFGEHQERLAAQQ